MIQSSSGAHSSVCISAAHTTSAPKYDLSLDAMMTPLFSKTLSYLDRKDVLELSLTSKSIVNKMLKTNAEHTFELIELFNQIFSDADRNLEKYELIKELDVKFGENLSKAIKKIKKAPCFQKQISLDTIRELQKSYVFQWDLRFRIMTDMILSSFRDKKTQNIYTKLIVYALKDPSLRPFAIQLSASIKNKAHRKPAVNSVIKEIINNPPSTVKESNKHQAQLRAIHELELQQKNPQRQTLLDSQREGFYAQMYGHKFNTEK